MWKMLKDWWYGAHTAVIGSQGATNTLLAILILLAGCVILGLAYLAVHPIGGTTFEEENVPFDQRNIEEEIPAE